MEGDLLGWQPPRLSGLVQSEDHVKGDAQQNLRLEAFIFHLRLRRQRDMSWSDGGLRRRHGGMSPGRGIILRFDNHQQGANLLNKKFAEGELLGRQPYEIFGLVQLSDHFESNVQPHLWREAFILHLGLGVDR
jgi:hypothetical protein